MLGVSEYREISDSVTVEISRREIVRAPEAERRVHGSAAALYDLPIIRRRIEHYIVGAAVVVVIERDTQSVRDDNKFGVLDPQSPSRADRSNDGLRLVDHDQRLYRGRFRLDLRRGRLLLLFLHALTIGGHGQCQAERREDKHQAETYSKIAIHLTRCPADPIRRTI